MDHPKAFIALCEAAQKRVKEIEVCDFIKGFENNQFDHLIDVRDAHEYAAGHIPQATHLSKGWCEAKIHEVVQDKDASIVLYCGGGNRSILAGDNLQKMGYTNVFSMKGGYKAWKAKDSPKK